MKMRITLMLCASGMSFIAVSTAFAYDKSYDAIYTAATGYVTLEADDTGNGANSSFHSAKNWSDKNVPPNYGVPHAGTNYYVKAGKVFVLDDVASSSTAEGFAGDSIVVGGQVKMNGAWGRIANCGPLTMLPDSVFYWVNIGNIVGGSVHVKGTGTSTTKPVLFRSGRNGNNESLFSMNADMSFSSDADGELYWMLDSGRTIGVTFTVPEDWSGFTGTFRMGRNLTFKTKSGRYDMAGHAIITTNAMLQLTAPSGQSEIGALTIQKNGVLNLSAANGTQTVKITKKLEMESGALVIPQTFSGNLIAAQEFHPVFNLTAEAAAAGLPDFSSIPVADSERKASFVNGHEATTGIFPGLNWIVRDAEGGGKTVGFSYKETVAVTNGMTYGNCGFIPNGTGAADPANFWADGQYPQKGKSYYSPNKNLIIRGTGNPYVFPGDSFMIYGGAMGIYSDSRDMTVSNLVLCGNGRTRLMNSGTVYHLRGTLKVLRTEEGTKTPTASCGWKFNVGDKCTQFIDSDISGDGVLAMRMDTEVGSSSWNKTLPCGIVELTGDNSAFQGKMTVDCWQTVADKYAGYFDTPYQPGPYSNITLRVSSQSNLGGALPQTAYDALTISNECRLTLLSTADFDEPTRGWFFPENAYLRVEEGAVATVTSPITYGQKLVKEGVGTLMLGGTASVAAGLVGRPQIKIEAGSLGFVSATAISGLDVDFSSGTSLCVKVPQADEGMADRGVDLLNASITSSTTIPIVFDMPDVGDEDKRVMTVPVCTISTSESSSYADLFSVHRAPRGYGAVLTWTQNADSTMTLRAVLTPKGFVISFR